MTAARTVTAAFNANPLQAARFLDFPLAGQNYPQGAYTPKKIATVMDHSMQAPYTTRDGRILSFTGEEFFPDAFHKMTDKSYSNCYPKKLGNPWSDLLLNLYVGTGEKSNVIQDKCTPGVALNYDDHPGYDYQAGEGTAVFAAAAGTVVSSKDGDGCIPIGISAGCVHWGAIGIDHGNGYITQYLHNSKILVAPGQVVKAGETVALSGWKGLGKATAAHLHFEVLKLRPGFTNNYQIGSYAYVDPYGFDSSNGIDYLASAGPPAGGIASVCLWKTGCTNP